MEITITSDAWWETKVGEILESFPLTKISEYFYFKSYPDFLEDITIIFLCLDPAIYGDLKDRSIYSKRNKSIKVFFVLDYNLFMTISKNEKRTVMLKKLQVDLFDRLSQVKNNEFDLATFKSDWKRLVK